ncbi:hypothetical protein MAE02_47990 [Microvirga aerophila]|uniref:Uncharacterized protein n=1 Tax=Microvirga aerophila TaxID=670291 RepID=A0A512BYT0_9HYPH|nr:hypothetical protein MAE02_47990 [Microvirga aerophila]
MPPSTNAGRAAEAVAKMQAEIGELLDTTLPPAGSEDTNPVKEGQDFKANSNTKQALWWRSTELSLEFRCTA